MISLRRLAVQNYLSLHDVDVELRDLNVLVGPNGAGKSNLLDAIQFLGDTAREDLQAALDLRGGYNACFFQGQATKPSRSIRFEVETVVTKYATVNAPDQYTLSFWQTHQVLLQRWEEFKFKRYAGRSRRITVRGGKIEIVDERLKNAIEKRTQSVATRSAALSTLPRLGEKAGAEQVRQVADLFTTFRVYDINVRKARDPSPLEKTPRLADDASNLAPFLRWLSEEHEETFNLLQRDLQYILSGLQEIRFRPVGGSTEAVAIELIEQALSEPTPLARASFGSVRALALLAMLHDPNPPKLTCAEEVDHGLHPYALDRLVERMRTASERTQLIVATHSPALVNRLRPEELIVCERDEKTGASLIPAVDPDVVAEMASDSSLRLGELWFSGALGGVPE